MQYSAKQQNGRCSGNWEPEAPGVWRMRLGEPEEVTPTAIRETAPAREALSRMAQVSQPPISATAVVGTRRRRGFGIDLALDPDERIFGFGLQLKAHDQTALKRSLRMNSDPAADTGDSHAPVPYYVSTAGYAVLVDTARYAAFYCGSHPRAGAPHIERRRERSLGVSEEELYREHRRVRGPMSIDVPSAAGVDIYLFAGPGMLDAVRRYVLFSGGGVLPPMWGLGNWYRGFAMFSQDEALALARSLRESDIPVDVFGLEPGWQEHAYPCSFTWSRERFPDPEGFVAELRELGYRLNLWEHLYTHPDSPLYPRVADKAGSFEVWNGAVPDLFVPEVAAAFAEHHRRSLGDADGFKLDECDNSDFVVYPWSFPEHSEFPSGLDGEQMHSLMGLRYQQLIAAIYRERNRRSYSQVRASHALAASSPFVLYSDLYGHEDFIRGLVNAGLSGLLWSPEVRVARSATDLLRRLQTVVFSPHALVNGWTLRHPPWRQWDKRKNRGDELMSDWEALEAESRFWFRLRMRFLPYLYAAFAEYRFAGTPPFRPLVSEYPDDPETYGIDDQYLMGPDLLVAPLTAASDTRRVYIPAGAWYEFWTGTRIEGPRRVDAEAQLPTATAPEIEVPDLPVGGRIPLYVRAGAILPLAAPEPRVAADTQFRITAWCYGTPCRDSYLFEDDGESFDFESGVYNRLRLRWEPGTSRGPVLERESAGPRAYAGKRYVLEGYQVL